VTIERPDRRGVRVRFLGTGTPLGQRGLHQACILVETDHARILLDCGMTALVSLARAGLDPHSLDAVLLSHLHGDHFGGLPLLVLDATLRRRTRPLTFAGPAATRDRLQQALDLFGWTSARMDLAEFAVLGPRQVMDLGMCVVTAFPVPHNAATAPSGLRVSIGGATIGYSGDAGWCEALEEIADDVDLFICGVWSFNKPDTTFLDLETLLRNRDRLRCRRLMLTHLGPSMLEHLAEVTIEVATDGLTIEL
jgi:ribonuclease BN (tRNA processing enzyme)